MPPPPSSEADALYVVRLIFGDDRVIKLKVRRGKKPIEELMSDEAKQATGLTKLSDQDLANLNSWLDPDKVVAPGDPPH